jgi:hypothetical protein
MNGPHPHAHLILSQSSFVCLGVLPLLSCSDTVLNQSEGDGEECLQNMQAGVDPEKNNTTKIWTTLDSVPE